ncbi:MazG-like family protein [Nitzschia inconspicua]|uniref:MazG-like family protein n=1 Tax=Nitzschia inconspicua TaxID=303405 RepID=A0A9K3PD51_9STRA|nr:MazG-like family protein [Nitzschia inconspicua]
MMATAPSTNDHGNCSNCSSNNNNNPRSCILQVGVCTGRLCELANTHPAFISNLTDRTTTTAKDSAFHTLTSTDHLVTTIADLFVSLWLTSRVLKLNLIVAIQNKLKLNGKKYPVEHCKGKAGKYTQYSHLTGITKTNQVTEVAKEDDDEDNNKSISSTPSTVTHQDPSQNTSTTTNTIPEWRTVLTLSQVTMEIPRLANTIASFAEDRLWTRYHTPRNLVMALLGEVGELSELLQFKGDDHEDYNLQQQQPFDLVLSLERKELDKLSQELADVSIYLLRLATVCDVVSPLCEALDGMTTESKED